MNHMPSTTFYALWFLVLVASSIGFLAKTYLSLLIFLLQIYTLSYLLSIKCGCHCLFPFCKLFSTHNAILANSTQLHRATKVVTSFCISFLKSYSKYLHMSLSISTITNAYLANFTSFFSYSTTVSSPCSRCKSSSHLSFLIL